MLWPEQDGVGAKGRLWSLGFCTCQPMHSTGNLTSLGLLIWNKQYFHNRTVFSILGPWITNSWDGKDPVTLKNPPTLSCFRGSVSHLGDMPGSSGHWCVCPCIGSQNPEPEGGVHRPSSEPSFALTPEPLWAPALVWSLPPDVRADLFTLPHGPIWGPLWS